MARITVLAAIPASNSPMPQLASVHRGYIRLLRRGGLPSRTRAAVLGRLRTGGRPGGCRDGCAARDTVDA